MNAAQPTALPDTGKSFLITLGTENLESYLQELWQDVLGVAPIGLDDEFFQIAHSSLDAVQIIARVEAGLNVSMSISDFFENPTIRGLAQQLRSPRPDAPLPLRPRTRDLPVPVSDIQEVHLNRFISWGFVPCSDPQQNLIFAYRLSGLLDIQALEGSLREICRRHESLRTHFDVTTKPPLQVIESDPLLDFVLVTQDQSAPDGHEAAFHNQIEVQKQEPFNYVERPCIRFRLLRISEDLHYVIIAATHFIIDLFSMGILHEELARLYAAHRRGEDCRMAPPPIQYADFVLWQREYYPRKEPSAVAYWRGVFAERNSFGITIPFRRPRPDPFKYESKSVSQNHQRLDARVRSLSEARGVSGFSIYLAAYFVLLYKISRERSLFVFTPDAQRVHVGLDRVIGRFGRAMVLRCDIEAGQTFGDFTESVARGIRIAQDYSEMSTVKLHELSPKMDMTQPVSYVGFALDYESALSLDGLDVQTVPIHTSGGPWFDLNLRISVDARGTELALLFNVDSFTSEECKELLESYMKILVAAIDSADYTVGELVGRDAGTGASDAVALNLNSTKA